MDRYRPKVDCVQATYVSLILRLHFKDLYIIERYLPLVNSVQATNVSLILQCTPT